MSRGFEGGGGNQFEYDGDVILDTGAGGDDVIGGMYLGSGGGDPLIIGVDATLLIVPSITVPEDSIYYSPSRIEDAYIFSQEGGWVLALVSPGLTWAPGDYRVDIVNDVTGKQYPDQKPGCNSALFGKKYACRPALAGRQLRFTLPAAPVGDYWVKVTTPLNVVLYSESTIHLTYVPESRAFRAMSRFPFNVLRVKSPIQEA